MIELGAGFDPECTARENIFLNGCVLGHSQKFMQDHFDEIVDFAEIRPFLDSPLKNYSSGMKARLGFAIATMVKPDILIVDEILAVGDAHFQAKCLNKMKELKAQGKTMVFVSHNTNQIKSFCDRALWIKKGEIVMDGPTEEVLEKYIEEQG